MISPIIPGCEYFLSLQAANGKPVLGGVCEYKAPAAKQFEGYNVTAEYLEFFMCRTPSYSGWDRYDLWDDDYTTTFEVGENASFLVHLRSEYDTSDDEIVTLFVYTDENGIVAGTSSVTSTWRNMWYKNYCELDIPSMPNVAGNYTISVYFNGLFAVKQAFSIVES